MGREKCGLGECRSAEIREASMRHREINGGKCQGNARGTGGGVAGVRSVNQGETRNASGIDRAISRGPHRFSEISGPTMFSS
jgi:hypothetical protein